MKSIRVSNLRCLSDTGEIEMKPLMILVGANSSGKSSFLRIFPLFKQSIETKKRGPLLWFGPEVDFGSFESSVLRGENLMHFDFQYEENRIEGKPSHPRGIIGDIYLSSLSITIGSFDNHDRITHLELLFCKDQSIRIDFAKDGMYVSVNERSYGDDEDIAFGTFNRFGIIPSVFISNKKSASIREVLKARILKEANGRIDKKILERDALDQLLYAPLDSKANMRQRICETIQLSEEDNQFLSFVNDTIILSQLDDILDSVNTILLSDFGNVSYIKPLRASAERYYRTQNFTVEELASDGHNMAMFLNELNADPAKKKAFQKWTKSKFKFEVDTEEGYGHISIKIKDDKNDDYDNIADMGSGYAQLLPIIIMLWQKMSAKDTRALFYRLHFKPTRIIAIEQPELHLHPSIQMRFADVLSSLITEAKSNNISFIIETHSKEIINRLGIKVEEKALDPEDVSILLFDETHKVRKARFTPEGVLQNWPIGFFEKTYE